MINHNISNKDYINKYMLIHQEGILLFKYN